jgi:hypothetical protein
MVHSAKVGDGSAFRIAPTRYPDSVVRVSSTHASKGAPDTALRGLPRVQSRGFSFVKELRVHACSVFRMPESTNPNRP